MSEALLQKLPEYYRTRIVIGESIGACWRWTGGIHRGYARAYINNKIIRAHREIFSILVLKVPANLVLDHVVCGNKACVNPFHLEVVTAEENSKRHFAKRTHCKFGHEMTEENTYAVKGARNARQCRTCQRNRDKAWRERQDAFYRFTT